MTKSPRKIVDFNFDWKFARDDDNTLTNAFALNFSDSAWKDVRLPHDWSVECSFTQEDAGGSTAFLPGGIGWYRKTFTMSEADRGKLSRVEFDGVYNDAEVWINGHYLGKRPYGYINFSYDLTPYLNYGGTNVIAVKADRTAYIDCRWYPGSGIYRNVRLVTVNPVHISEFGVFVTTPVATEEKTEISVETTLANTTKLGTAVKLMTSLYDATGAQVAVQSTDVNLDDGAELVTEQRFDLTHPQLWDTESPNMYKAVSTVICGGVTCDTVTTPFGIRDIRYDADRGFFLNGKNTLLKGVCLHHDGGSVGAAVPLGVWERRLRILKAAGVNAIRTAHNPPSAEFLDLCDQMGFLVQDEAFDEWTNPKDKRHNYNQQAEEEETKGYTRYFMEWGERDVKAMVLRDRNHPSIIMWSTGNEIEWTYPRYQASAGYWDPGDDRMDYYYDLPPDDVATMKEKWAKADPGSYEMAPIGQMLAKAIKSLDDTRAVTQNLVIPSVGHWSGLTDELDIVGYSYRRVIYQYGHELYPEKMIFGSENWCQWHEWKPVLDMDFIPGIFLWTGISYLGESRRWPTKASSSGLLDLAGFKRPRYHMFRALWNDSPYVYAVTSKDDDDALYEVVDGTTLYKNRHEKWMPMWGWQKVNEHWNYKAGDDVFIDVYTNCPKVELFVNGESLGVRDLDDYEDHIIKWKAPYADGKITAVGYANGAKVAYELCTSGDPSIIKLITDKTRLKADRYDVGHIEVQVCDTEGNPVRTSETNITFDIQGPCRLLGIDNGATDSVQDYQSDHVITKNGRALLIVQALDQVGTVTITATADGLSSNSVCFGIV